MMEEKGIGLSTEQKNQIHALAKQGKTPLLFADEKQFLGIVAVADVVKPTSKEAVQKFRDYGIHVIMLTGDNEVTAQAIKEQVGIDEVIAEHLSELDVRKVCLIPDLVTNLARNHARTNKDFDPKVLDFIIEGMSPTLRSGARDGWYFVDSTHLTLDETVQAILEATSERL